MDLKWESENQVINEKSHMFIDLDNMSQYVNMKVLVNQSNRLVDYGRDSPW